MSERLAKRYAQALFELAVDAQKTEDVYHDITKLGEILSVSDPFASFVQNPTIPTLKRQDVLKSIFKGKVQSLTYQFLLLVESKHRLNQLELICSVFEDLYYEHKNILKVHVHSRKKLNAHQVNALCQHLKLKFKKNIESVCSVHPEMLGGIKIQVRDRIYDYSLRTQLSNFKHRLLHA